MIVSVILGLLWACATRGPTRYDNEWEQRKQHWLSQIVVWPKCDALKGGTTCEFVAKLTYDELPAFLQSCNATGQKDCAAQATNMLFSRLQLKYKYADWQAANLWCGANPNVCNFAFWQGAVLFEMQLIMSHNQMVHDLAMQERDNIERHAAVDQLQRQQRNMNIYGHMFDGVTQMQTVNCQSTSNYAGGFNTVCH